MNANGTLFPVRDYDLAATLASGQAFRWRERGGAWEGVVSGRWIRLRQTDEGIHAETAAPQNDWRWLVDYLQINADLPAILATFPDDPPMSAAVNACRGLRLLRQDPWECLASFICSSTKRIVQIQQIIALLCERFGEPVAALDSRAAGVNFSFPSVERIASASEVNLRGCKMGFRAPNLLATARRVASGGLDLERLRSLSCAEARAELVDLSGVGPKIADCVLLFAYGFQDAFPVDVWVRKALRELYFPRRRVKPSRLARFAATHFGPWAGYAQQYLFHYMRVHAVPRGKS